jgi:hypothetical protein
MSLRLCRQWLLQPRAYSGEVGRHRSAYRYRPGGALAALRTSRHLTTQSLARRLRESATAIFGSRTSHILHCETLRQTHTTIVTTNVTMSTSELATSYAALILADDGVDITVRLLKRGCVHLLLLTNYRPTSSNR